MPQLMIVNPAKRRSTKKRRTSAKRTRARKNPSRAVATIKRAVRRHVARRSRVRANPVRRSRRIRHNPLFSMSAFRGSSLMGMVKDAAVGGVGAVGVDYLMQFVTPKLPDAIANSDAATQAVRAAITVAAGRLLKKPTKGLSEKMAVGALIVQAYNIVMGMLGANAPLSGALGYGSPAKIVRSSARVGPMQRRMGQFVPNVSAVLNGRVIGYSPTLSGSRAGIVARGRIPQPA